MYLFLNINIFLKNNKYRIGIGISIVRPLIRRKIASLVSCPSPVKHAYSVYGRHSSKSNQNTPRVGGDLI